MGDTLAIVSNAIGPGRLAADSVLREGLHLLAGSFPDHALPSAELAAAAFDSAARPDVGGVLVVHAPTGVLMSPPSPAFAVHRPTCARLC